MRSPMAQGSPLAKAVARQVESNRSGAGHEGHFASHRARLTLAILARAPAGGEARLCLLGAGNAFDVDLDAIAGVFREVHLVDIDAEAVAGAVARVSAERRARVVAQAPVDVSGVFDRFEAWSRAPPTPGDLADQARSAVERAAAALPGPFDVVVSCCLLTQLQLVLLEVVGDRNPRFEDIRAVVNRVHVRLLCSLLAPGGIGLLVTDLTDSNMYPLDDVAPDADLGVLMRDLLHAGNIIHVAHPGLLSAEIRRDPDLSTRYRVRTPVGPWLWHNGPASTFLVYAMEITSQA